MFVYSPQLLLLDTPFLEGMRVTAGACLGVFLIGMAVEGYLFTGMNALLRLVAFAGALCLIDSGIYTDMIGLAVMILICLVQRHLAGKTPAPATPTG
jgi:TRAP-type uncharacterized transport system fused permease subunit